VRINSFINLVEQSKKAEQVTPLYFAKATDRPQVIFFFCIFHIVDFIDKKILAGWL